MKRREFLQGVAAVAAVAALGPRLPDLAPAIRVEQASSLPIMPAARALLNDGRWHQVWVTYRDKVMRVWVDDVECLPDGLAQVSVNVTRASGQRQVVGAGWRQCGSPPTDKSGLYALDYEVGPDLTFDDLNVMNGDYVEILSTITVRGS